MQFLTKSHRLIKLSTKTRTSNRRFHNDSKLANIKKKTIIQEPTEWWIAMFVAVRWMHLRYATIIQTGAIHLLVSDKSAPHSDTVHSPAMSGVSRALR